MIAWAIATAYCITLLAFVARDVILRWRKNEIAEQIKAFEAKLLIVNDNMAVLRKEFGDVVRSADITTKLSQRRA